MTIFTKDIETCKKGCGKDYARSKCGDKSSKIGSNGVIILCHDCKSTLSTLQSCEGKFNKFIEELKEKFWYKFIPSERKAFEYEIDNLASPQINSQISTGNDVGLSKDMKQTEGVYKFGTSFKPETLSDSQGNIVEQTTSTFSGSESGDSVRIGNSGVSGYSDNTQPCKFCGQICEYCGRNKAKNNDWKRWDEKDILFLKENNLHMKMKDLCLHLNRTSRAIQAKASSIGLLRRMTGELNPMWKGDDVNYRNLHKWVVRNKHKSDTCELCGKITPRLDASNISGKYKRDINDFRWLCRNCHIKTDDKFKYKGSDMKLPPEKINNALSEIRNGMQIKTITKKYGVNRSYFRRFL